MAKRKRSRRSRHYAPPLMGFGADDVLVADGSMGGPKKTDWFWPIAIGLTGLALVAVIWNTKRGKTSPTMTSSGGGGGGSSVTPNVPALPPASSGGGVTPGLDPYDRLQNDMNAANAGMY